MTSTASLLRTRASLAPAAFALALAALAFQAAPAAAQNPPEAHQEDCENGWATAPANASCTANTGGVVALTWGCKVSGTCPDDDGKSQHTSISLEVDQFPQLRNCDGALTISQSSC